MYLTEMAMSCPEPPLIHSHQGSTVIPHLGSAGPRGTARLKSSAGSNTVETRKLVLCRDCGKQCLRWEELVQQSAVEKGVPAQESPAFGTGWVHTQVLSQPGFTFSG